MEKELGKLNEHSSAAILRGGNFIDSMNAHGYYEINCYDRFGKLKWKDDIHNVVVTEGKNALLTHVLKGSAYTSTVHMGLIEDTGYGFAGANGSGVASTNLASAITAAGSASPANGWNEAQASTCASRATPTFGAASSGSIALSANQTFAILATDVIKGIFVLIVSAANVAPTSTVGNTNGALLSAGLFTGGDKSVGAGDTLSVSYSLTV